MSGVAGWYYGHYVYRALNVLCKFVLFQDSCEYSCHVFVMLPIVQVNMGKAVSWLSFISPVSWLNLTELGQPETDGAGMPDHAAYDKYSVRNSCGIPYENGGFCSVKGGVR